MKLIIIFLIFGLISSCSLKKDFLKSNKQIEISQQDTISNYYLFDYIDNLTENDFLTKLDSVKKGTSKDFFSLRMAYTKTKKYSPYASDLRDSLITVRALIDSLNYKKALSLLSFIQDQNFVNIPSHLYCGYIYKELGDSLTSEFHYGIYNGLLNSIYASGDGRSPKTAYIVISAKEEYYFLDWFNLQFNGQSLIRADDYSFDLMKITDSQTQEKHEIYFNIELAFSLMRKVFDN